MSSAVSDIESVWEPSQEKTKQTKDSPRTQRGKKILTMKSRMTGVLKKVKHEAQRPHITNWIEQQDFLNQNTIGEGQTLYKREPGGLKTLKA